MSSRPARHTDENLSQKGGGGKKSWHHDYDNVYVQQMMRINYYNINCTMFICACGGGGVHITFALVGVSSPSQMWSRGSNSDSQAWQRVPLPTEPYCQPFTKGSFKSTFHPQESMSIVFATFS